MRCRRVKKLIPLFVGGDLREREGRGVRAHLRECEACRAEYESSLHAYTISRRWLAEDELVWEDADWKRMVLRAVGQRERKALFLSPWPFRRVWAFILMAAVAAGLSWVLIRPGAMRRFARKNTVELASSGARSSQQDVLSMTMVSQETGLKIVWFFDKNFDLEDNKQ
jgi:predicted anti-sigma-YlaC factor YlaD